jgi:hypothetical protein
VQGHGDRPQAKEERLFFFEKKNQKTFAPWRVEGGEHSRQRTKVFCFFSSEKKSPSTVSTASL